MGRLTALLKAVSEGGDRDGEAEEDTTRKGNANGKGKHKVKGKGKERPLKRWTKNEKAKTQKATARTEASKPEGEDPSWAEKRKEPEEGLDPEASAR